MNAYFRVSKRAAESTPETLPKKRRKQDGQHALERDGVKVPLDAGFPISSGLETVYIAEDGLIYDVSLNQTDIAENANKFYRLQVVKVAEHLYRAHTRWGRVGHHGGVKTYDATILTEALLFFSKQFRAKTGLNWSERNSKPKPGKYTFVQKSYVQDDDNDVETEDLEMISGLPGRNNARKPSQSPALFIPTPTRQLVELIFAEKLMNNALDAIGYNQVDTPIGKLSKETILKGYCILSELAVLLCDPANLTGGSNADSAKMAFEMASNRYYSTIPHISPLRTRLPSIDSHAALHREIAMLDNLSQLEIAAKIKKDKSLEARLSQLNLEEIIPLQHESIEFSVLKDYLVNSAGDSHDITYKVKQIFRISRKGEKTRFLTSPYADLGAKSDKRLLWHGSRTSNFGGILPQGLCIAHPNAPVNGYAFGKGIYFADCSTKSANYCFPHLSNGQAILLLCEVELGKHMKELDCGFSADPRDDLEQLSTHGVGRYGPMQWVDAGRVNKDLVGVSMPNPKMIPVRINHGRLRYHEYIVYSESQVQIRYLFHIEMLPREIGF